MQNPLENKQAQLYVPDNDANLIIGPFEGLIMVKYIYNSRPRYNIVGSGSITGK